MCEGARGWHWRRSDQLVSVPQVSVGASDCRDHESLGEATRCQNLSARLWRMGLLYHAPVVQESVACSQSLGGHNGRREGVGDLEIAIEVDMICRRGDQLGETYGTGTEGGRAGRDRMAIVIFA